VSVLPPALRAALAATLGSEPVRAVPLGGGMVNRAAHVETRNGPAFVKWNEDAPPGLFATEANGLHALRATQTLRVPEVLAVSVAPSAVAASFTEAPPFLALEYIEEHPPSTVAAFAQRFGEALSALHRATASPFDGFGLAEDNYLGRLPQRNTPHARWPDFYRDCRLLPQIIMARTAGRLPPKRERLLMRVVEQLDVLLDGLESRPVLLHGDLWSGNFITVGDEAALVDPAIYYGEREMEIAFIELFGGFPHGLLSAYRAAYPLDPGYERRRPLHQLYPLLVHLNHFGETYGPDVERACRLCLG
jgi:fructosamine-3-kinase